MPRRRERPQSTPRSRPSHQTFSSSSTPVGIGGSGGGSGGGGRGGGSGGGGRGGDTQHNNHPLSPPPFSTSGQQTVDYGSSPPDHLCCPLTHNLLEDPVSTCDGFTYERGHIEAWFRTCEQNGNPVINPMTNLVLKNTILVPNFSIRFAVEHYITRQQGIEAMIQEETSQQQNTIDTQEQFLEPVTQPNNIQTDVMAETVTTIAENQKLGICIPWYFMIICLGLLMIITSMALSLRLSFYTAPAASGSANTLHPSVARMRNGWISTIQHEQEKDNKVNELLAVQARQAKLENERKFRIDRLNHNRRYWEQREREERDEKQREKQHEKLLHGQRKTTKVQLCAHFFQLVTNALTMGIHLGLHIYVLSLNGLHAARYLISQPHLAFIMAIIIFYPCIYFYLKIQKAIKKEFFLANSEARKERRETNKQTEEAVNVPDSSCVPIPPPPRRRNRR